MLGSIGLAEESQDMREWNIISQTYIPKAIKKYLLLERLSRFY